MSTLYLIRHGQASLFAEDYDRLSPLGVEQARALGDFWIDQQCAIDEVYVGSLLRQRATAAAVGERLCAAGMDWPEPETCPGLDEYQADAILDTLGRRLSERDPQVGRLRNAWETAKTDGERYRTFHRYLAAIVGCWIGGTCDAEGVEPWTEFRDRVRATLEQIRSRPGRGRSVAVFTSGGPIGVCVQSLLEAPDRMAGELHWRIFNASVTQLAFTAGRVSLDQFNSVAHLPEASARTYR